MRDFPFSVRMTPYGYCHEARIELSCAPSLASVLAYEGEAVRVFSPKTFGRDGSKTEEQVVYVGIGEYRLLAHDFFSGPDPFFVQQFYDVDSPMYAILPKIMLRFCDAYMHVFLYADSVQSGAVCRDLLSPLYHTRQDFISVLADRTDDVSYTDWVRLLVRAQEEMRVSRLEKVVLSRETTWRVTERQMVPVGFYAHFVQQLSDVQRYHYLWRIKENLVFGHSPEALLSGAENKICVDVVAGTRMSGSTERLLDSEKDKYEHEIVRAYVVQQLSEYGKSEISACSEIVVGDLCHLYQKVCVSASQTALKNIIHALHPTPALCGAPKEIAYPLIANLEQTHRRWYGGFFGVMEADKIDLAVTIRGIEMTQDLCRARVGAGVVLASNPDKEWEELENKLGSIAQGIGALVYH